MKIILITGLDGSGKSSLINKLEDSSNLYDIAVLRVPKIDSQLFVHNALLYKTTCFVNDLHIKADEEKIPQLKVIAMFSSMVLFNDMLKELQKNNLEYIFCERHPIIDTAVYAHFYSGNKMDPDKLPETIFENLNEIYDEELKYILSLLDFDVDTNNLSLSLLKYIHEQFNKEGIVNSFDLSRIFRIGLPDKIYFLDASPEILMQRLTARELESEDSKNMEVHETLEALNKMLPVYNKVLDKLDVDLLKIDANSFEKLDDAFEMIKTDFLLK